MESFLRPCANRAISFEHALIHISLSGPLLRCRYSRFFPVVGHCTELTECVGWVALAELSNVFLGCGVRWLRLIVCVMVAIWAIGVLTFLVVVLTFGRGVGSGAGGGGGCGRAGGVTLGGAARGVGATLGSVAC